MFFFPRNPVLVVEGTCTDTFAAKARITRNNDKDSPLSSTHALFELVAGRIDTHCESHLPALSLLRTDSMILPAVQHAHPSCIFSIIKIIASPSIRDKDVFTEPKSPLSRPAPELKCCCSVPTK